MNPTAELFYCPYCAEEDLYPAKERDAWRCASCQKTFSVALISIGRMRSLPATGEGGLPRTVYGSG